MEGDIDTPSSLVFAFASVDVIFAVTTMYNGDMGHEVMQGKNIADATAAAETLERFVWSTLPAASSVSAGKVSVLHMVRHKWMNTS